MSEKVIDLKLDKDGVYKPISFTKTKVKASSTVTKKTSKEKVDNVFDGIRAGLQLLVIAKKVLK